LVRSERRIDPGKPFPSFTVVDEYEVTGSIRVGAIASPPPSRCQPQKDAYTRASQDLQRLDAAILDLQGQLARAPVGEKPQIRKEIEELRQQRPDVLAQVELTRRAYDACLAQQPNPSG
jgi:hypothetical protein